MSPKDSALVEHTRWSPDCACLSLAFPPITLQYFSDGTAVGRYKKETDSNSNIHSDFSHQSSKKEVEEKKDESICHSSTTHE